MPVKTRTAALPGNHRHSQTGAYNQTCSGQSCRWPECDPVSTSTVSSTVAQRNRGALLRNKSSVPNSSSRYIVGLKSPLQQRGLACSGFPAAGKWSGAAARGMRRSASGDSTSCRDSRWVGERLTHKDSERVATALSFPKLLYNSQFHTHTWSARARAWDSVPPCEIVL